MARAEDGATDLNVPGAKDIPIPAGGAARDPLVKETGDDYEILFGGATESIVLTVGDESTAITAATDKLTFRMPYAFVLTDVRASCNVAPVTTDIAIDLNEGGVSVFSTVVSIDATTKTSVGSATPAVISDAALADDAEMTVDFDTVGTGTTGAGVKLVLIGYRA